MEFFSFNVIIWELIDIYSFKITGYIICTR